MRFLGSATPQIANYHAAQSGRLGYLPLPERVRDLPLPETVLIDCRGKQKDPLTPLLKEAMAVNRPQAARPSSFSTGAATPPTWSARRAATSSLPQLRRHPDPPSPQEPALCHYCDYSIPAPSVCPGCGGGGSSISASERSGSKRRSASSSPQRGSSGWIGTPPRARGACPDHPPGRGGQHRHPDRHPDGGQGARFPASPWSGWSLPMLPQPPRFPQRRADLPADHPGHRPGGRGDLPGRVLVQTLAPEHYALTHALAHDYPGFYEAELAFRSELDYPPFAFLARHRTLRYDRPDVGRRRSGWPPNSPAETDQAVRVTILGPAPAALTMLRGRTAGRSFEIEAEKRPAPPAPVVQGNMHCPGHGAPFHRYRSSGHALICR